MSLVLLSVILTQLAAAISNPVQVYNPEEGSFLGFVRDSANNPLPGGRVFAVHTGTNLHRDGRILPSGLYGLPHLPRGIYRIHVEVPGYEPVIRIESIEKGPSRVNLLLSAVAEADSGATDEGKLTGTVRGFNYVSLRGARITVRNNAGRTLQITSDDTGAFSISDLPSGALEVVVEHEGFQTLRLNNIQLTGKSPTQLHVKLRPQ